MLEVQNKSDPEIKFLEKDSGIFSVTGLVPGTKYQLIVTARNNHGPSKPLYLDVETFLLPSELIAETKVKEGLSSYDQDISVVSVIVTFLSVLVTAVILLIIFLRLRSRGTLSSPIVSMTLIPKNRCEEQQHLNNSQDTENTFFTAGTQHGHHQVGYLYTLLR